MNFISSFHDCHVILLLLITFKTTANFFFLCGIIFKDKLTYSKSLELCVFFPIIQYQLYIYVFMYILGQRNLVQIKDFYQI